MSKTTILGAEGRSDGMASVRITKKGRCELIFESGGDKTSFPCSLGSLVNVGLGARTHLASEFGACVLTRTVGGVRILMTPWGQDGLLYLVPADVYADALDELDKEMRVKARASLM